MKTVTVFKNLVMIKPIVLMTFELQAQVMAFVNGTNHSECQWFHTVERTVNTKGDKAIYKLDRMLIPEQEVSGATVESPDKGMLALWNELKAEYTDTVANTYDRDALNAVFSKMHAWCHSHVNMAVIPSNTDESTFGTWIKQNVEQGVTSPVLMIIVNKREEMYIRLYDPELNIYCENPDLEIIMPAVDTTYVQEAIKTKIKNRTFYTPTTTHHSGGRVWTTGESPIIPPKELTGGDQVTLGKHRGSQDIPALSRIGKNILGAGATDLEKDIYTVIKYQNADKECANLVQAIQRVLREDIELKICELILKNDITGVSDLVGAKEANPFSREETIANIQLLLNDSWTDPPNVFYALIAASTKLGNLSGKASKRIKEAEIIIDEYVDVYAQSWLDKPKEETGRSL